MVDQLLTVISDRAVVSSKFTASPGVSVLEGRFQCELACDHIVIRPGEHVHGAKYSIPAPQSAACNQCKKEPDHG